MGRPFGKKKFGQGKAKGTVGTRATVVRRTGGQRQVGRGGETPNPKGTDGSVEGRARRTSGEIEVSNEKAKPKSPFPPE